MASFRRPCYAGSMHIRSTRSVPPDTGAPMTVPPDVEARLRAYVALLATWTRRINLVSAADHRVLWERHVLDSLRLVPLLPGGASHGIDLGSGAGLPGLVLAIATGITFDLVESDRRKAAFLMEAARVTAAPVRVHAERIEACGLTRAPIVPAPIVPAPILPAPIVPAPIVTARALAPLVRLLPLAAPLLAPGGTMLFPKGARADAEIAQARATWSFDLAIAGDPHSPVLCLTNPRPLVHG